MARPSLEDWKAQKRALTQALHDVGGAHRKVRRTAAGVEARQAREWVLVDRLRETALIIYVWSGFAPELVVVYWLGAGRQRG